MSFEKPTLPQMSEEELHQEFLQHRQNALEKREEFTQALEAATDINEFSSILAKYAFLSDSLSADGELVIPGFAKVFPEYQGNDDFGFQKDDYAIDTEHSLESTLN